VWSYVFWRGLVGWGLSATVLYTLAMTLARPGAGPGSHLLTALAVFPAAGMLWSLVVFRLAMRLSRRDPPD
jgi:hypothetical protein